MADNRSKTSITAVIEGENVDDSVATYSPVDIWNSANEEVLLLSSDDDEQCGKVKRRRSSVVIIDSATKIANSKESCIVDLCGENVLTPKTSAILSSPKPLNISTNSEDCEVLSDNLDNEAIEKLPINKLTYTLPNDPQSSKSSYTQNNGSFENTVTSTRVEKTVDAKDCLQSSNSTTETVNHDGLLQVDEIINACNVIDSGDGVIIIDDSDSELEASSSPPRPTRKRKISLGSSPIAVCSKNITSASALHSQHTDTTVTFYLLSEIELISEKLKLDKKLVEKVVKMMVDDCTVPFISRYRQHDLQGLDCNSIREISDAFKELKKARKRVEQIEKLLQKQNRLLPQLKATFSKCMNIAEVERQYLPYSNEDDEAIRAKHLGLDKSVQMLIDGVSVEAQDFVKINCNGLENVDKVVAGWKALITDMICKDPEVMTYLSRLYKEHVPVLETELDDEKIAELYSVGKENLVSKYLKFNNWKMPVNSVNTQTVFQLNRGESEGLLRVYVIFSEEIQKELRQFCMNKWEKCPPTMLSNCVYIAWDNVMKPNFAQHIRWELTTEAHKVALNVFRDNVKYLLLEEPIRGKTVLGIDPGYDNGCKLAVVSPWGVPVATTIVHIINDEGKFNACQELKRLVLTFECYTIALGNGTGCRLIEQLLLNLIKSGQFKPFDVSYKIVSESGVSCYSVSSEAIEEFPDLQPNLISAVSLARRLQDPLSELVKTDPKKLQVGMYIRDIESEKVEEVFNEVVVECVSFVGVDVNVASQALLCKVSGITPDIAKNILKTRIENGPFKSREELRVVEGVTSKHFEQFAGFVRILSETSQVDTQEFNYLDATIIHPESYDDAERVLKYIGVEKQCIGSSYMCEVIDHILSRFNYRDLAVFCTTSVSTITFLLDAFKKPLNFDMRLGNKSCYKPNVIHFDDIKPKMNLSGRVVNVTPIGAFIDVGLGGGQNAFLPPSNSNNNLVPGQIVLVKVTRLNKIDKKFKVCLKKIFK